MSVPQTTDRKINDKKTVNNYDLLLQSSLGRANQAKIF
jgi:hypothetical protein